MDACEQIPPNVFRIFTQDIPVQVFDSMIPWKYMD